MSGIFTTVCYFIVHSLFFSSRSLSFSFLFILFISLSLSLFLFRSVAHSLSNVLFLIPHERSVFLAYCVTNREQLPSQSRGHLLPSNIEGSLRDITSRGHLTIAVPCMAFHMSFDHRLRGYCGDSARLLPYIENASCIRDASLTFVIYKGTSMAPACEECGKFALGYLYFVQECRGTR